MSSSPSPYCVCVVRVARVIAGVVLLLCLVVRWQYVSYAWVALLCRGACRVRLAFVLSLCVYVCSCLVRLATSLRVLMCVWFPVLACVRWRVYV